MRVVRNVVGIVVIIAAIILVPLAINAFGPQLPDDAPPQIETIRGGGAETIIRFDRPLADDLDWGAMQGRFTVYDGDTQMYEGPGAPCCEHTSDPAAIWFDHEGHNDNFQCNEARRIGKNQGTYCDSANRISYDGQDEIRFADGSTLASFDRLPVGEPTVKDMITPAPGVVWLVVLVASVGLRRVK